MNRSRSNPKSTQKSNPSLKQVSDTSWLKTKVAVPETDAYGRLIRRIRAVVRKDLPSNATVIVVSKGDPGLLKIGRRAWHFPRTGEGKYAGYHPSCSTAAIAHLEALRAQGGQYLLLPSPAFWWFEYYGEFRQHVQQRYRLVTQSDDTCWIYSLCEPPSQDSESPTIQLQQMVAEFQRRFQREPAILDCDSGIDLARMLPKIAVFTSRNLPLPYLDRSVDIVATRSEDRIAVREAHRVATAAIVTATRRMNRPNPVKPPVTIQWLPGSPSLQLPSASIIIPCYAPSASIETYLRSLLEALWAGLRGEIIVVHDAENPDSSASVKGWTARDSRVRAVRTHGNPGFSDACTRGARIATGKILVFVNSNLILLPDWLPPLLRTFRDFPNAGVVGGKLLFPDGTLQEAGGIVFRDGSVMHFGRGDFNVDAPLYNFLREVDCCSGLLFATQRKLFNELGGFSPEYRGYYYDTDYCFNVQKRGYRIYCQPETVAVHRYDSSGNSDSFSQANRYATTSQLTFQKRWPDALQHQPVCPSKLDQPVLQALAVRAYPSAEMTS